MTAKQANNQDIDLLCVETDTLADNSVNETSNTDSCKDENVSTPNVVRVLTKISKKVPSQ